MDVKIIILCGGGRHNQAVLNIIFGLLWGGVYYYIVTKYYNKAENEIQEKNVCDYGYDNYRCATIKDGTVIVKKPQKTLDKLEKTEKEKNDEINETYYD